MSKNSLWIENQPLSIFGNNSMAYCYEERALLAARAGDLVILDFKPDECYLDELKKIPEFKMVYCYFLKDRYDDLVESIIKWNKFNDLKKKVQGNKYIIKAYIPDSRINSLGNNLKCHVIGSQMYILYNSQMALVHLMKQLEISHIDTLECDTASFSTVNSFFGKYMCVIGKPNFSIGGENIRVIDDLEQLKMYYNEMIKRKGFILQRRVKPDYEGSIQFLNIDGEFHIFICKTYNPNYSYVGFLFSEHKINNKKIETDSIRILDYFKRKFGVDIDSFGIDFIVSNGEIYYHDLNPRKTAVSYILLLLHNLYHDIDRKNIEIMSLYIDLEKDVCYEKLLNVLQKSKLPYLFKDFEGIAFVNDEFLKMRKIQIVSVSFYGLSYQYIAQFCERLGEEGILIKWPNIKM